MKTQSAKSKGRKLQQYVRDKIIEVFKKYGVLPDDVKSTSMGASGMDVQLSPFASNFFPYATECKSHKSMAIYTLFKQAEDNTTGELEPLLVVKINNKNPLAVVRFDHFMKLLEELEEERNK